MLDRKEAIACVELLDPEFVRKAIDRGIQILPVPARSAATLGCNTLSLGERRIIASAGDAVVSDVLAPPCVMWWPGLMWVDERRQPYDRIGHRLHAVVLESLKSAGYAVETVDLLQFAGCGGGIHCLTQPIRCFP